MSTVIQTESGLYVNHRGRIDYIWVVKPMQWASTKNGRKKTNKYGQICVSLINFPKRFVGKKFRIKLEEVKNGTRS